MTTISKLNYFPLKNAVHYTKRVYIYQQHHQSNAISVGHKVVKIHKISASRYASIRTTKDIEFVHCMQFIVFFFFLRLLQKNPSSSLLWLFTLGMGNMWLFRYTVFCCEFFFLLLLFVLMVLTDARFKRLL